MNVMFACSSSETGFWECQCEEKWGREQSLAREPANERKEMTRDKAAEGNGEVDVNKVDNGIVIVAGLIQSKWHQPAKSQQWAGTSNAGGIAILPMAEDGRIAEQSDVV